MIPLKPFLYNDFTCPECGGKNSLNNGVRIEGLHSVADNECLDCGFEYLQLLPVGHTVEYPIAFGKRNSVFYDNRNSWVTKGLTKYFEPPSEARVVIKVKRHKEFRRVVLLNALDFLYGHTLLKLFNCQFHLKSPSEVGLVVLIPHNFEWLVPDGCSEVWSVDLPLSRFHYRHTAIHEFVATQLERFDQVFLSNAYTHPDLSRVDIGMFTGIAPFDLSAFNRIPTQITFVLREDRFWLSSRIFSLGAQGLRRIGLAKAGLRLMACLQNRLVDRTIEMIRREFPDAKCTVVGIGCTGRVRRGTDQRAIALTTEVERDWCRAYAHSHVVIGIHGSNMILPTAHAAGCVEILPDDRVDNLVQDIAVRFSDRRLLFLYRFLHEFAKPADVARHVVSMLKGYENFNLLMCRSKYRYEMMNIHGVNDEHHGQERVIKSNLQ